MLQYAPQINATIKGLGAVIENQGPAVRMLAGAWPVTLLAGAALFFRFQDRWKKGELTLFHGLADAGMLLAPVVSLVILADFAKKREKEQGDLIAQAIEAARAREPLNGLQKL